MIAKLSQKFIWKGLGRLQCPNVLYEALYKYPKSEKNGDNTTGL